MAIRELTSPVCLAGCALVGLLTCLTSTGGVGASPTCQDPPDLHDQWAATHQSLHESHYLLPYYETTIISHLNRSSTSQNRYYVTGNMDCPTSLPASPDAALSERALCPWYHVHNHDSTRWVLRISFTSEKVTLLSAQALPFIFTIKHNNMW